MREKANSTKREIIMILAAAAAALVVMLFFLTAGTKVLSGYETVRVATVRKDIAKGTKITEENLKEFFELREVNKSMLPEHTMADLNQLKGQILCVPLQKNEIVTEKDMNNLARLKVSMLDPIELTFTATSVSDSVGGIIRSGDVINVGITYQTDEGQARYRTAGENIYVIAAMDDSGKSVPPQDSKTACTMFRVIMEQQDAEKFLETLREGDETIVTLPRS